MPLVIVGTLLLLARWLEFGPFATMSWWWVALPFFLAFLWWQFADGSGLTMKRAMDKMERRKVERRDKAMEALGLNHRREKRATRQREDAARRTTTADPTQRGDGRPPR
jgi:small Trp-rich protein